jgi:hypothetical protein
LLTAEDSHYEFVGAGSWHQIYRKKLTAPAVPLPSPSSHKFPLARSLATWTPPSARNVDFYKQLLGPHVSQSYTHPWVSVIVGDNDNCTAVGLSLLEDPKVSGAVYVLDGHCADPAVNCPMGKIKARSMAHTGVRVLSIGAGPPRAVKSLSAPNVFHNEYILYGDCAHVWAWSALNSPKSAQVEHTDKVKDSYTYSLKKMLRTKPRPVLDYAYM